jgi:hypothetical protein
MSNENEELYYSFSLDKPTINYANITNPNCGNENEISVNTVDLSVSQRVIDNVARLHVIIGIDAVVI